MKGIFPQKKSHNLPSKIDKCDGLQFVVSFTGFPAVVMMMASSHSSLFSEGIKKIKKNRNANRSKNNDLKNNYKKKKNIIDNEGHSFH